MIDMYPETNLWYYIKRAYKFLMYIISGVLAVILLLNGEPTSLRAVSYFLVFFVAMQAFFRLQAFFHELGHFVFGLLSGYRLDYFQLFGYCIQNQNKRIRVVRKKGESNPFQCIMAPPDTNLRDFPVRLFFLGGFLMNILFIALFLYLAFLFPRMSLPRFLFLQFVLISGLYVLIYAMPIRLSGACTDTYNAITVPKDYRARSAFFVPRLISYSMTNGIRLRDMPEEWFYLPDQSEMLFLTHSRMCSYYVDWLIEKGRYTQADETIDYIYSLKDYRFHNAYTTMLFANKIFLILVHTKKYEQLKTFLSDAQKDRMIRFGSMSVVKRTQYIIALLYEKDLEKAAYLKSVFLASKSQFDPTEFESELELIEIAEACAREEQNQQQTAEIRA